MLSPSKSSKNKKSVILILLVPIQSLIRLIDYFYPKDKKSILFGSNMGEYISGSPKALYDYILINHPEYKVNFYNPFRRDASFRDILLYIITYAHIFFRAKFLVGSHPPHDFFPYLWSEKKIFINAWHGTPLKSVFYADLNEKENNLKSIDSLNKRTNAFIVSSRLEAATITECFLINPKKLVFTGHPRNDCLLNSFNQNSDLSIILGDSLPKYEKIILYCPTYRRNNSTVFFPFTDMNWPYFQNFLKNNKLLLLIRGHASNDNSKIKFYSDRILNFNFDLCEDVNSFLPCVDIMVTDYSSLYIDFLLLDKPCIFIPYDIDSYIQDRGFLYDDYDFWAPGEKARTCSQFIDAIVRILHGVDHHVEQRQILCKLFHYHQTENSCEKLFSLIKNWEKKGE